MSNWYAANPENLSPSLLQTGHNNAPPRPSAVPGYMLEEQSFAMFHENLGPVEHALPSSAGYVSQRKDNPGHTDGIFNEAHIGTPHPIESVLQNSRYAISGNRFSTYTNPTTPLFFAETASTRSSTTPFASDGMNWSIPNVEMRRVSENPMSDLSTPDASECAKKTYLCPKCNMGTGHVRRGYRGTQERPIFKQQWDAPRAFDKHVMECHIYDFKRPNSSEYVCCYCICTVVGNKDPECGGRFKTAEDLVDHLRNSHSNDPPLHNHPHPCAPISEDSYPPALRAHLDDESRFAQSDGSTDCGR